MAKRVRLSPDGGTTWYTLPGNSGQLQNEAGAINDTIFGQSFSSSQTGLIGATVNANGIYKGFAGYLAKLKKSGSTTAFTGEAMTLVSGKTYKITAATKNVWDRAVAVVVYDNAVDQTANVESIDYLFGRVTFKSSYSPTGPVTVDGSYFPMASVGKANAFTLTQTANAVMNTDFDTAQANSGHRTYEYGLRTVALELQGIYALANGFRALLDSRAELMIEVNPDGSSKSVARGFFKPMQTGQSGDVGDLEQETIRFDLSVPDDEEVVTPFKWIHDSTTTLSLAIRTALDSWQDTDPIDVQYLPDGTTGIESECIITDISLAGGVEAMNEFTVNAQISGAISAVT